MVEKEEASQKRRTIFPYFPCIATALLGAAAVGGLMYVGSRDKRENTPIIEPIETIAFERAAADESVRQSYIDGLVAGMSMPEALGVYYDPDGRKQREFLQEIGLRQPSELERATTESQREDTLLYTPIILEYIGKKVRWPIFVQLRAFDSRAIAFEKEFISHLLHEYQHVRDMYDGMHLDRLVLDHQNVRGIRNETLATLGEVRAYHAELTSLLQNPGGMRVSFCDEQVNLFFAHLDKLKNVRASANQFEARVIDTQLADLRDFLGHLQER